MKVLLTGSNGQVGWEINRQANAAGFHVNATDRSTLDICRVDQIDAAMTDDTDVVINAAAYTAVDQAESETDTAFAVNRDAPVQLARACKVRDIPLIHISTDYVFDGRATRPYREDDPVSPLGCYGTSKLAGEQGVREEMERYVILRTSWVFGIHGNNFVRTMLRLFSEREELGVVADQLGCPTYAGSIAAAILHIASKLDRDGEGPRWGTYHFSDEGPTTWHSLAKYTAQCAYKAGLITSLPAIKPIETSDYPTPAARPAYSVLNCDRFKASFPEFSMRGWSQGVQSVIEAAGASK